MKTREEIAYKLLELGISPAHKGFNAIIKFAELWNPDEKVMAYYAITGKHLNTTGGAVERNIRLAIHKAMYSNPKAMCEFMHYPITSNRFKPTIHEFMAVLHLYINAPDS